jgi:hypothetical protein
MSDKIILLVSKLIYNDIKEKDTTKVEDSNQESICQNTYSSPKKSENIKLDIKKVLKRIKSEEEFIKLHIPWIL